MQPTEPQPIHKQGCSEGLFLLVLICECFPEWSTQFSFFWQGSLLKGPVNRASPSPSLWPAHANANQSCPGQGSAGRLPGTGEQTRKECYFISGILGKEGWQREVGQWKNRLCGESRGDGIIVIAESRESEDHRKDFTWIKGLLGVRNWYRKLFI